MSEAETKPNAPGIQRATLTTQIVDRLKKHVQIIRYASWNIGPRGDKTCNEHARIVEAVARGDIAGASRPSRVT